MFPLPDEVSAMLTRIGFSRVRYHAMTNGIAVAHVGVKV
jgi:demethylmenaquinone methyltransferase/2-methoxy-6-polyprenyl-1,4-benzoquinol methylase